MDNLILHRRLIIEQPLESVGYIECKYNVTDTTKATKLLGFTSGHMGVIWDMEIEGVQVPVVQEYLFDSPKEYTVRFQLAHTFSALNMFKNCSDLVSVTFNISKELLVNLKSCFEGCEKLETINWGDGFCNKNMTHTFRGCKSLQNINLDRIDFSKSSAMNGIFRNCAKLQDVNFGSIKNLNLNTTFFTTDCSPNCEINLNEVQYIIGYSQPFTGATQPAVLDFGKCDLSGCSISNNVFFEFDEPNANGTIIMLGKPMTYPNVTSKQHTIKGTLRYNLDYDYSPLFLENPELIPEAQAAVNKTIKVRFCNGDQWVTDPKSKFYINGTKGEYNTEESAWIFEINAETYKYDVYYNEDIIGEIIVKNDIQQILFGENTSSVHKVIDFSSEGSFDDIIISNDGWSIQESEWYGQIYSGYANPEVAYTQTSGIEFNTGMSGNIIITIAQSSQTGYHFGRVYTDQNSYGFQMQGSMFQSYESKFTVQSTDGILRFTYSKPDRGELGPVNKIGLDRVFIKKIECYNWPELPE